MSLYFFHLRNGEDILLDPEGREFSGLAEIIAAALTEVRSIISHDALRGRLELHQQIDVEDSAGAVVHTIQFGDAVEISH